MATQSVSVFGMKEEDGAEKKCVLCPGEGLDPHARGSSQAMEKSKVTEQLLVKSGCQDLANYAKKLTATFLSPHVAVFTWPHTLPLGQERNCFPTVDCTNPGRRKGSTGEWEAMPLLAAAHVKGGSTTGQWAGHRPFQMVADAAGSRREARSRSSPVHRCLPGQQVSQTV